MSIKRNKWSLKKLLKIISKKHKQLPSPKDRLNILTSFHIASQRAKRKEEAGDN